MPGLGPDGLIYRPILSWLRFPTSAPTIRDSWIPHYLEGPLPGFPIKLRRVPLIPFSLSCPCVRSALGWPGKATYQRPRTSQEKLFIKTLWQTRQIHISPRTSCQIKVLGVTRRHSHICMCTSRSEKDLKLIALFELYQISLSSGKDNVSDAP